MKNSDLLRELLSEAVHTAFRKGCNGGTEVHQAMSRLPAPSWADAIDWMAYCLEEMGVVVREEAFEELRKMLDEKCRQEAASVSAAKLPQEAWRGRGRLSAYHFVQGYITNTPPESDDE